MYMRFAAATSRLAPLTPPTAHGRKAAHDANTSARSQSALFADIAAFLIPSANFFSLRIVGELPGGEILVLVLLPLLLLFRGRRISTGRNKTLLSLLALWFLGQLVTDAYRNTAFQDMAKGLALIVFFAIDLIALSLLLYRSQKRMLLFGIGVLPALAGQCLLQGYETLRPDLAWKLGFAPILNPALILLTCYFYRRRRLLAMCALDLLLAAANLYFNFRSAALIIGVSVVLVLPLDGAFSGRRVRGGGSSDLIHSSKTRALLTLGLVLIMGYAISSLYSYTAASGILGPDAKLKYDLESRGKYGLLVGGRPETLVSGRAVLDSPILGHGSWAKDPKYSELLSDQLRSTGYADNDLEARYGDQDSSLIPTHSHLMTAWVFSGILGAVFWFYVLALCIRASFRLSGSRLMLAPYFSFLLVLSVWDIFFSPFASYRRLLVAFVLVVINFLLSSTPEEEVRDAPPYSAHLDLVTLPPVMPRFPYPH